MAPLDSDQKHCMRAANQNGLLITVEWSRDTCPNCLDTQSRQVNYLGGAGHLGGAFGAEGGGGDADEEQRPADRADDRERRRQLVRRRRQERQQLLLRRKRSNVY